MRIDNEFRVPASVEQAWALLTDIEAIAPCLPGARLTGSDGDTHTGTMKVKVGPITAEYKGTAAITELDEVNRRVLLAASGRDSRGAGNASADIEATMTADGDGTLVAIGTDLRVAGKVAQFGRGVMADVSTKLIGQFAECIEAKLAAKAATGPDAADPADPASGGPGPSPADGNADAAASSYGGSDGHQTSTAGDATHADEPLDLLDVAGAAVAKRLIPVALVVAAVVVLLLVLFL